MQIQQPKTGYKCVNTLFDFFEEIPEDWDVRSLCDFAIKINKRYSKNKEGHVLSVTKYKGFVKSLDYFKKQIFSKDIEKYKLVEKGDFAYATIHLDEGAIGLLKEFECGYISPMYTVFRTDDTINSDYLHRLLKTESYLQKYLAIGEGTVNRRKTISFDNLSKLKIPLPPLKEQQKISSVLHNVDSLIDQTQKTIDQIQRLKKGLMQKLLTKGIGHTKFKMVESLFGKNEEIPEDWNLEKLGDVIQLEYGKGLVEEKRTNSGYPVYGSGGVVGSHEEFIGTGPAIIVARKGSLGNVFLVSDKFWAIDTVFYITKEQTKQDIRFLFYLLQYLHLENFVIVTAQPGISREEVYTAYIKVPPLAEQQKIEAILSNVDSQIQKEQEYKTRLESLKKGLMQKLLTGQIRVKV